MIVPDRCQHGNEIVASKCQRTQNLLKTFFLSGMKGEQPIEVALVDALREEYDDFEEVASIRVEFPERWEK